MLPREVRSVYDVAEREFVLEMEGEVWGKTVWAMQKYLWLRRLCSGWLPSGEESTHKVDELLNLLRGELSREQIVIWCQYRWDIDLIKFYLPDAAIIHGDVPPNEREELRKAFQAGELKHAIIQPETMKFGSKWTAAGALVYFDSPESATTRNQTEDRSLDVATQDNILIIDLVCADTIEEDILMNLLWKDSRSNGMEQLVKAIQRRSKR